MNLIIILLAFIIIIGIVLETIYFIKKEEKNTQYKTQESIEEILESREFYPIEICYINKHLYIAVNKTYSKIAIVENFNPNNPQYYHYEELATSFIESIEKRTSVKLNYRKKGELQTLNIHPITSYGIEFIHTVFLKSCIRKLEGKFSNCNFDIISPSDWECSYIWAYCKQNDTFAYFKTIKPSKIEKINLRKKIFTLDTKYNYFEAPIFNITQQLFSYNKNFIQDIFTTLFKEIKDKCNCIKEDTIYYDSYNEIVYISNGFNSLQSIPLKKIEEIFYNKTRLTFTLKEQERVINFITNDEMTNDLKDFIINYNLQKIASSFNHVSDKLINTTENTKFIIDYTRDRIIYCANLNKLAGFTYIIVSMGNIANIKIEKFGQKHFVRIYTKEKNIIDVTCDKLEIAQYIEAQILNNAV